MQKRKYFQTADKNVGMKQMKGNGKIVKNGSDSNKFLYVRKPVNWGDVR